MQRQLLSVSALALFSSLAFAQAPTGQAGATSDLDSPVMTIDGMRFLTWEAYTSSDVFTDQGLRCGRGKASVTINSAGSAQPIFVATSDCTLNSTNPSAAYAPTTLMNIPVVFHVMQRTNGTGFVSEARCQQQIDILNEDFRALSGTPGAPGVDTMIQFYLATVDPSGNTSTGVTYSTNNSWYDDNGSYWNSLAWDTDNYLNIYTNSASGSLGYVPNLPQGGIVGQNSDRVVALWSTIGRNGPIGFPFNQGRTVTHEVGHYLGLEHTFTGGCNSGNCNTSGDLICDTNRQSSPTNGCPGNPQSCGSQDPWHNYMDYSNDTCMWEFTEDQTRRMRCTLESWRPDLADGGGPTCLPATSSSRAGANNPNALFVTAPKIGTTMSATINLLTTGHSFALYFASLGSTNFTLGGGQTLLASLFPPFGDLLSLAPTAGPIAVVNIGIPNDPSLCGLQIFSQAALFGNVTPFALTNGQDLVLGD